MKTTLIALTTFAISMNAMASQASYSFVPVDQSVYSNLCVVAAQQGIETAKTKFADFSHNTLCNGMKIGKFARKYNTIAQEVAPAAIKMVAADEKPESQLCVKAAEQGIETLGLSRWKMNDLYCNGQSIKKFVKSYSIK
ncbi:hypothetical protein [Neptunicella sp.]|uniref:hypothetical protein n=1 Tax=Neptunicella sp. TaxID=2125986 RepID=UPI003F690C30